MPKPLTVQELLRDLQAAVKAKQGKFPVAIMEVIDGVPIKRDVVCCSVNDYDGDVFWIHPMPEED